jgi:hypothetical protein
MKIKVVFKSVFAKLVSAIFFYFKFSVPATLAAIAIRRKMPDAWFSGLIVWYALLAVIAVSIVIGGIAFRTVYKHAIRSAPTA